MFKLKFAQVSVFLILILSFLSKLALARDSGPCMDAVLDANAKATLAQVQWVLNQKPRIQMKVVGSGVGACDPASLYKLSLPVGTPVPHNSSPPTCGALLFINEPADQRKAAAYLIKKLTGAEAPVCIAQPQMNPHGGVSSGN